MNEEVVGFRNHQVEVQVHRLDELVVQDAETVDKGFQCFALHDKAGKLVGENGRVNPLGRVSGDSFRNSFLGAGKGFIHELFGILEDRDFPDAAGVALDVFFDFGGENLTHSIVLFNELGRIQDILDLENQVRLARIREKHLQRSQVVMHVDRSLIKVSRNQ